MNNILWIILVLLFSSCTKKYQTLDAIKKSNYRFNQTHNPITPKLYPGRKEIMEYCTGQFLFFSNAKKDTEKELLNLIRYSCPQKDYLVNSKITEIWWTTLVYSRACIQLETYCPL